MNEYAGRLAITWPAADPDGLHPWGITATDADTGEMISTITRLTVHAEARADRVIAEAVMLIDTDGNYLRTGNPVPDEGGGYRCGVFWWLVTDMCVSSPADRP